MLSQKQIDLLRKLMSHQAKNRFIRAIEKISTAEASVFLEELDESAQKLFIELLAESNHLTGILSQLPKEDLTPLLMPLEHKLQVSILSQLPPDRSWAFLQNLELEQQHGLLELLPKPKRDKIEAIATYPEESCGYNMQTEFLCVQREATTDEAIKIIRSMNRNIGIFYLYVVDDSNHLVGVLPLRSLLKESGDTEVAKLMISDPVTAHALEPLTDAAKRVAQYNLLAIPVVNDSHHLVGVITVDDVVDIIQDEATEDMFLMAGLGKDDRIDSPMGKTIIKRLNWMLINLATAFLAAWVVGLFEASIEKVVALAIFMPVVAGMGGNGGTQSLTIITRSLALGEIDDKEMLWATSKQMLIGLAIGTITGLITGIIGWLWQDNFYLGLVLWLAMIVNMLFAGLAGALVPAMLRTLKQDPALGSGVIVTTFTDIIGFLSFLGLATLFLKYLV